MTGPAGRSPFSDAAQRLHQFARDVKRKQCDATGVKDVPPDEPQTLHPEEEWVRNFATRSFRPKGEPGMPPLSGFISPPADMPRMPPIPELPSVAVQKTQLGGHIGSALGKPGPGRSWLGRLFRGRGI